MERETVYSSLSVCPHKWKEHGYWEGQKEDVYGTTKKKMVRLGYEEQKELAGYEAGHTV